MHVIGGGMWQLAVDEAEQYYAEKDSAHGFGHVLRVYYLCQEIGQAEGADWRILRMAALLHDAENSLVDSGKREHHHLLSADFAGDLLARHGWTGPDIEAVQHCIRAHRYRDVEESPRTIEAKVLFDADKLDSIGAIGAARAIAVSVERGLPLYEEPSEQFLGSGQLADGERHSAYHEYWFKLRHVYERLFTDTAGRIAMTRQAVMDDFFEQLKRELLRDNPSP